MVSRSSFNQEGHIFRYLSAGGTPQLIDTGAATNCSGSHGFSPDGKWLAITCSMPDRPDRHVYIVPSAGGTPRLVTENVGYFRSWSPDGKTIAFTRGSRGSGNIYSVSVDGGPGDTPLTTGSGISDDPDYSPDGKYIYFNSDRSGSMEIWRMNPDGSRPSRLPSTNSRTGRPILRPDGKSIVFISYDPSVTTHAANKDIALRILSTNDNKIRTLVNLIGGDGSMNIPNWSPDSKSLTFVSYRMLPAEDNGSTE